MKYLLTLLLLFTVACSTAAKSPHPAPSHSPTAAAPAKKEAAKTAAPAGDSKTVACESGADKRTLTLIAKDAGCELKYAKAGSEKVVATSGNGVQHCEASAMNIRKKLEGAGFTCK